MSGAPDSGWLGHIRQSMECHEASNPYQYAPGISMLPVGRCQSREGGASIRAAEQNEMPVWCGYIEPARDEHRAWPTLVSGGMLIDSEHAR